MIETLSELKTLAHQLDGSGIEFPKDMIIELKVDFNVMKELNRYSLNEMTSVPRVITYQTPGTSLRFKLRQK